VAPAAERRGGESADEKIARLTKTTAPAMRRARTNGHGRKRAGEAAVDKRMGITSTQQRQQITGPREADGRFPVLRLTRSDGYATEHNARGPLIGCGWVA